MDRQEAMEIAMRAADWASKEASYVGTLNVEENSVTRALAVLSAPAPDGIKEVVYLDEHGASTAVASAASHKRWNKHWPVRYRFDGIVESTEEIK